MTFEEVIDHFDGKAETAKAVGVTYQAVVQWEENGVPQGRQWQIQALTDGKLKADTKSAA